MICPLRVIAKCAIVDCNQSNCAWWNKRFRMCCIAVDAHLKGAEDRRKETELAMRNKYEGGN